MTAQITPSTVRGSTSPSLAWLKRLGNVIIDQLFPPHCVICHRYGAWLCNHCLGKVDVIHPPICYQCGLPQDKASSPTRDITPVCEQCRQRLSTLDGRCAYAFHNGPLRQAIHHLKYQDQQSLAIPLGRLMSDGWAALSPCDLDIDVVVPVPLHTTRQKERGYNQATLLALELGAYLQRPVVQNTLVRIRATAPQVELGVQERRENVRNAFRCINDHLSSKRVLLIDDVCTTGSTLEAASNALRDGGVSFVWAYTLAQAKGESGPSFRKSM